MDHRCGGVLEDAMGLMDLDVHEAGRVSERSNSARVSAPAMRPVQCAVSARVASSTSASAMTSAIATRPPARRTCAASRNTRALSPHRLMTQLEITTSTLASGSGNSSR
ncbi:MAG TPA: hypothetical protein VGO81_01880 [Solirubrobacteraceae bacterium]|nr:hypothetical protein [Solirubrobacteraceae bacterium]